MLEPSSLTMLAEVLSGKNTMQPFVITNGEAGGFAHYRKRQWESVRFYHHLNTNWPTFLNFPDGKLNHLEITLKLYDCLAQILEKSSFDFIIFTSPDMGPYPHPDHKAIGESFVQGFGMDRPPLLERFHLSGAGLLANKSQITTPKNWVPWKIQAIKKLYPSQLPVLKERLITHQEPTRFYNLNNLQNSSMPTHNYHAKNTHIGIFVAHPDDEIFAYGFFSWLAQSSHAQPSYLTDTDTIHLF